MSFGVTMQQHSKAVFTVRRKVIHRGDSAASPEWRALHMPQLTCCPVEFVNRGLCTGVRIDKPFTRNLRGRSHIAFGQRSRESLRFDQVVQTIAERVGRQVLFDVYFNSEQLSYGARIFITGEPLEKSGSRVWVKIGRLIELCL